MEKVGRLDFKIHGSEGWDRKGPYVQPMDIFLYSSLYPLNLTWQKTVWSRTNGNGIKVHTQLHKTKTSFLAASMYFDGWYRAVPVSELPKLRIRGWE